jgi:DNA-binding transcriptional LysR family regulator
MNLEYLKYFHYVVLENGFTKASEKLHIQQPVISRAVKLLEESLGCKLIERQRKQVLLTKDGEYLFEVSKFIFAKTNEAHEYFSSERRPEKISITCSDSLSHLLIEEIYPKIKKTNPNFKFNHSSGSSRLFLSDIENGVVDLGLFFNVPSDLPIKLSQQRLMNIEFVFVVLNKQSRNQNVLDSFIASSGHNKKMPEDLPLFKSYKKFNASAQIGLISNSSISRKKAVMKGLGVTILPRFLISQELKLGSLKIIGPSQMLSLYIIERNSAYRNQFKNWLISEVQKLIK